MILSYCDEFFFIEKSKTNYPLSPTVSLALTVAGWNGYRQCKYR